ncbi:MAG TPA: hypothetical protein VLA88_04075 [Candidatus Saccharimonadales bacterium]|nr:hypothetical protein [Candidatus Saccharimonadales bacterium]
MTTAQAFTGLAAFAATGGCFTNAMTYRELPHDADPHRVVARGYVLTRKLDVQDRDTDGTVQGTATVRVLRRDDGALMLRVRVEWTTSAGAQHATQAAYVIATPERAQAGSDAMAEKGMNTGIGETLSAMIDYNAAWRQEYPGALDDDGDSLEQYERMTGPERLAADKAEEYHARTVLALRGAEPDMLCMLSDSSLGSVQPDELDKIYGWLQQQPEYTS